MDPYNKHTFEIPESVNVNLRSDMAKKEQAAVVESAQQAAVVECAQELRRVGDLLDWKYRLLELIITLQKKQTGGKR